MPPGLPSCPWWGAERDAQREAAARYRIGVARVNPAAATFRCTAVRRRAPDDESNLLLLSMNADRAAFGARAGPHSPRAPVARRGLRTGGDGARTRREYHAGRPRHPTPGGRSVTVIDW